MLSWSSTETGQDLDLAAVSAERSALRQNHASEHRILIRPDHDIACAGISNSRSIDHTVVRRHRLVGGRDEDASALRPICPSGENGAGDSHHLSGDRNLPLSCARFRR
jgi:hypothetical protein